MRAANGAMKEAPRAVTRKAATLRAWLGEDSNIAPAFVLHEWSFGSQVFGAGRNVTTTDGGDTGTAGEC